MRIKKLICAMIGGLIALSSCAEKKGSEMKENNDENGKIENNNLEGKTVVCFATSGGSPIKPCVDALKKQYPNLNWTEGRLLNHSSRQDLQDWKKDLGL